MVFSSITFLFLFLPTVLLGYVLLPGKVKNLFLLCASLLFYYWGENIRVWLIGLVIVVNYCCALLVAPDGKKSIVHRKWGLFIALGSNLGVLAWFKYSTFMIESFNTLFEKMMGQAAMIPSPDPIALPLGISFFIFQAMSYTIDVYRGRVKSTNRFVDFACYVTLFPQLVAGPIVRYRDIEGQLTSRTVSSSLFSEGVFRFIIGLAKKVLIANSVAEIADAVFGLPAGELTVAAAWMGALCYTLQIYYDFSGYSDMAIGLGKMFGFRFLENFNYPYISRSIQEFWRRWHISLSSWFRDYLYIPLGGNRKGHVVTYRNLMIVFLLCGLWHGAGWSFIVWGGFHGLFLVLERVGLENILKKRHPVTRHLYTLAVVVVGWVFFRAETLSDAVTYLGSMVGLGSGGFEGIYQLMLYLDTYHVGILVIGILFSTPLYGKILIGESHIGGVEHNKPVDHQGRVKLRKKAYGPFAEALFIGTVFLLSIVKLSSGAYNPFIYFKF